ncbi:probable E3 ubiquitin-protein ligase makorin-1 [Prorops nasuta]|uniref:probable E3 ubiquitin-protein ligase makorin-1 n=1 Tax=Prorops nasuta TaxID=863751 RepID=UPI0034CD08CB
MADSWTQSVTCRYFKNNICREGENCRYRHSLNSRQENSNEVGISEAESAINVACRFFKQGICKFGSHCYFRHITDTTNDNLINVDDIDKNDSVEQTSSSGSATSFLRPVIESASIAEEWANVPEFVPSVGSLTNIEIEESLNDSVTAMPLSYAQACQSKLDGSEQPSASSTESLCPFAEATGVCKKLNCQYLHGEICEMCGKAALHPYNEGLRKQHNQDCVKQHEADMELSFAIQRSKDKSCGVCFEVIMEKTTGEQRFGILPNCNHCFCLTCIRRWRRAKQFDNKIIRACPECRVSSDFVCPSMYWVDTKEEKEKLITDYKDALSKKDCKYFNKGRGKCPFGNKCFYLHALPDGTIKDVGPPVRQRRNADSEIDFLHQLILWDFIDARENPFMYVDLDDISQFLSDSDDSDWSEYELSID